jgi:glutamate-ammonia-ligase adenylyltransferase
VLLMKELPPAGPWDVKLRRGGGMEVEFIAQVLQLTNRVQPVHRETGDALRHLAGIGALTRHEADTLGRADLMWRTVQSMLRITVGRATEVLPPAAAAALLAAAGAVAGRALDAAGLDATLEQTATDVRAIFNQRIGAIG